jgi:hypothetical protein
MTFPRAATRAARTAGGWHCHRSTDTVGPSLRFCKRRRIDGRSTEIRPGGDAMRRTVLIIGLLALAIGLLWIGQGTGAIAWPKTSFMINQIQWAGYGAALAATGLILIWQSQR